MGNPFTIKNLQKQFPRLYSAIPFYLWSKYAFPPMHVYFEVTYRCNLRCDMCHFLEIIEDTEKNKTYKNELSTETIKDALLKISRQAVVTFTGGEAFMKKDFMEIMEFATARNKVHIITNGTSLNEAVVDKILERRLKSFWGSGLFFLGVSLEGKEEFHDHCTQIPGSFRKTTKGLERLVETKRRLGARYPLIHLTCVIGKNNVEDLAFLYDYSEELGLDVCNFVLSNPAEYWHGKGYDQVEHLRSRPKPIEEIEPGVLEAQLDLLEEKSKTYKSQLRYSPNGITKKEILRYYSNQSSHKDYRCFSPWAKVGVSAYGDAFSCPHYRFGNIQDSQNKIDWNSKEHQEFRQSLKEESIFPGCLGCCQSEYVGD
jgi:MoaA/NifB/PqqE/SkfB family radical SAM enzyme